jgi:hypothetical protein
MLETLQDAIGSSLPELGGWGAEALDTEAKELYRIQVKIIQTIRYCEFIPRPPSLLKRL